MLKAVATKDDGTKLLILGVDEGNIERLKEGKPIHIDGGPLGFPGVEIGIMYGRTQQDIMDELKSAGVELPIDRAPVVTPDHPVIFDMRKKS